MYYVETSHEHPHKEVWQHMRKRGKPFPWKAHDCDFFDAACKKGEKQH